ncbi:hypothetical protein [Autumnicola edwardsiae]|uniref:Uncharacterized protein n=1 Tax=Autumnicola edwardsiae TaxID=3075594 RepID=A0ABU3CXK4_9FLAO|nr:hypothetical protein [Zunongwangia sp. F297]MDT0651092.1 hypothetical protein [Zunongwangia sp. F297]
MIELAQTELELDIKKKTAPHNQLAQGKQRNSESYSMNQSGLLKKLYINMPDGKPYLIVV